MVVIYLRDRLGNQLFQIAFGYAVAKKLNKKLYFFGDIQSELLHVNKHFKNLNINILPIVEYNKFSAKRNKTFFNRIGISKYYLQYNELEFSYCPISDNIKTPILFKGFWQSPLYFSGYEKDILELFEINNQNLNELSLGYLKKIQLTTSVAIHIRRGDYISSATNLQKHGICDKVYYNKSIDLLNATISNLKYFIFTDDPNWALEHMQFPNAEIVLTKNQGENAWQDMFLMSSCNHQIIANSSFSWWAAWLNKNENKLVIAPKIWFADAKFNDATTGLIPKSWIRL